MDAAASIPDLRPLSFSELLDRIFTYYRRRFWLFLRIMAIPQVFLVLLNVIMTLFQETLKDSAGAASSGGARVAFPVTQIAGFVAALLVAVVAYALLSMLALGATTFAVSETHMGRVPIAQACFRRIRARFWRLIWLMVLIFLRLLGVGLLFGGAIAGIAFSVRLFSANGLVAAVTITLAILGAIAAIVLWVLLGLRYSLSTPALLLEDLKGSEAIRRSVLLSRGNLGRIILILLLMSMVTWGVSALFQGPFTIIAIFFAIKNQGQVPFWVSLPSNIAAGLGQALTTPLVMIGLALLYYDARVRKEGFDLQLIMDTMDQHGIPARPS